MLREGDRLYVTQEMLDKQKSLRVFYSLRANSSNK